METKEYLEQVKQLDAEIRFREDEIIVLRVKKLRTYEYYRNSDELKNLAKQEVRRNVISGILENEKYIGETYPALDSVDITKYLRTDKS